MGNAPSRWTLPTFLLLQCLFLVNSRTGNLRIMKDFFVNIHSGSRVKIGTKSNPVAFVLFDNLLHNISCHTIGISHNLQILNWFGCSKQHTIYRQNVFCCVWVAWPVVTSWTEHFVVEGSLWVSILLVSPAPPIIEILSVCFGIGIVYAAFFQYL